MWFVFFILNLFLTSNTFTEITTLKNRKGYTMEFPSLPNPGHWFSSLEAANITSLFWILDILLDILSKYKQIHMYFCVLIHTVSLDF